jgi:putative flippase GtrA
MVSSIKYFAVTLCGFFIDFSIYVSTISVTSSPYFANALGFLVGAAINVVLIRTLVFRDSKFPLGTDIIITILVNGMMLVVGMFMLWLQIDIMGASIYTAKLISNGLTFLLNYLTRFIFFRKK